jgi:hypothetical protein
MWLDVIARGWEVVTALFLFGVAADGFIGWFRAPADSEGVDEGVLMDDAYDRWIDEQNEVA